ncbi:MAG: DegT/DnrJ/EryC1/StrS family aminotransferase [Sandaracinaceae bacterium]
MDSPPSIPVYAPWLCEADARAVAAAVRRGDVAQGPDLVAFERELATFCGAAQAVAVSNGTVALELALRALGIGPGDAVICPSLTIVSCAIAIVRVGARPVFVDADPIHWGPSADEVANAIGPDTAAILGVHLYGHPFDPALVELAAAHELALLEDAAEAHGAEVRIDDEWKRCGSVGDAATFSFYANKAITSGEGGAVSTSDPAVAERVRSLRNLCFAPGRRFRHAELGTNARLSNLAAALGRAQLARIDEVLAAKRALMRAYRERLDDLPELAWQGEAEWARPVPWMVGVVLDDAVGLDAEALAEALGAAGVETRPFFLGMHAQPPLAEHAGGRFPIADRLAARGLYLPSDPRLRPDEIDRVADAVRCALGRGAIPRSTVAAPDPRPFGSVHAAVYDALYADKPYAEEVDALLEIADWLGAAPRSVVDFGCGTGRHALAFAQRGLGVTGVEPSDAMLARARERFEREGLDARWVRSTAAAARVGGDHDLATMLFAVLSYHDDEDDRMDALAAARRSLRLGGLLMAEVWYGPAVLADPPGPRAKEVRVDGVRWTREARPLHEPLEQRVRVGFTLRSDAGDALEEQHVLRYFFPRELAESARRAGFETLAVGGFPRLGPLPGDGYPALLVARAV